MATCVKLADAVDLDLPGRKSREILSGQTGADSTVRLVEIAVPDPGMPRRPPHWHPDSEECIHILSGQAATWVDGQTYPMGPGDTIHIAPGERHVTSNTGDTPLMLLCFFPVPEITIMTEPVSHDDT